MLRNKGARTVPGRCRNTSTYCMHLRVCAVVLHEIRNTGLRDESARDCVLTGYLTLTIILRCSSVKTCFENQLSDSWSKIKMNE